MRAGVVAPGDERRLPRADPRERVRRVGGPARPGGVGGGAVDHEPVPPDVAALDAEPLRHELLLRATRVDEDDVHVPALAERQRLARPLDHGAHDEPRVRRARRLEDGQEAGVLHGGGRREAHLAPRPLPVALSAPRERRGDEGREEDTATAHRGIGVGAAVLSTFTAQNLNSGILPMGSSASVVRRLAAASRKWKGMKTEPGGVRVAEPRTVSAISPRRELHADPVARRRRPRRSAVVGVDLDEGLGLERVERLRAARHHAGVPVLEHAAGDEDERVLGVGQLVGAGVLGRRRTAPRPSAVGKPSPNITTVPSECSGSGHG